MTFKVSELRYLDKTERKAVDVNDEASIEKAVALNRKRYEDIQGKLALDFTKRAREINDAQKDNKDALELLNTCIRACQDNVVAGLDMFLYSNHEFRASLNAEMINSRAQKDNKRALIDYTVTAARAGEDEFRSYVDNSKQFRALLTTADAPGAANTVDTTVSQSIVFRAENIGNVLPLLAKVNVPYGDYAEPYYNKYGMGGYLAEDGTIPDFNTALSDGTNGITKKTWTPKDYAYGLKQSFRSLQKLSPAILNQIFDLLAEALNLGMEYQAVSGPGTGVTDSGIVTVATSITYDTNVYITFVNACSNIGSKNVRNKTGIANAKAIGEFKKLRVIDRAYADVIVPNAMGVVVDGVQIIEVPETVIATSGSTTTVAVGDLNHYLLATSGDLKEYPFDNPESLQRFTAFHMLRHGQVRFADSFAKFSVTDS